MIRGLIEELKGMWHGFWCDDKSCECRVERPTQLGGIIAFGQPVPYDEMGTAPEPLKRFPKYPLGAYLKRQDTVGVVTCIYSDLTAAIDDFAVGPDWWECQDVKPSSKDQVFYGLVVVFRRKDRRIATGALLVGENDVELVAEADVREV
jgi:hypothetical protein